MAQHMNAEQLAQLHTFIKVCQENPEMLHIPELAFFKSYLQSMGARIPEVVKKENKPAPPPPSENVDEPKEEAEIDELEGSEESEVELDTTGVVEPDPDEPYQMGDDEVEVTEEMMDESDEKRAAGQEALSEGKLEEALELFTQAILKNPQTAALYAKRAGIFLKLLKPNAAIRDCNKALSMNPDQALAFKCRGRARQFLGEWEEAANDLATACRIDYTDEANDWLKEVLPNARKLQEHRRKYERKNEEKILKEKRERIRQAQEEYARSQQQDEDEESASGFGDQFDGAPGGMPANFMKLLSDPEVAEALKDPEIAAAFQDITQNPNNFAKYQSNPKVASFIKKMIEKMM